MVESSVFGLLLGGWLWGILTLGAHNTMAAQEASPSDGEHLPGYVVACPGGGEGSGCLLEARSHTTTTRQPGRGLTERGHPGDH
jgi:hypothetical protein